MSNQLLLGTVVKRSVSRVLALFEIDMDTEAERFILIDRRSLSVLHAGIKPPTNIAKVLMPQEFATGNYSIAGIVDDNGVYDCKFMDGVMLQLVDANTVDMSQ